MAICAYCKKDKKLTREHVWPACFLKKRQYISAHFSIKGKKVHGSDYVVKDVCEDCNGIILSVLDKYFCELTDNYFEQAIASNDKIQFEYNFNLLSRALLKIAYNTSRAGISDSTVLSKTSSYILGDSGTFEGLIILLEIVGPNELMAVGEDGTNSNVVEPKGYRSGFTKLSTPNGHKVNMRLVSVNAFYFYLLIPILNISHEEVKQIKEEALLSIKGAACINEAGLVELQVTDRIWAHDIVSHIAINRGQYKTYFTKERKKKNN